MSRGQRPLVACRSTRNAPAGRAPQSAKSYGADAEREIPPRLGFEKAEPAGMDTVVSVPAGIYRLLGLSGGLEQGLHQCVDNIELTLVTATQQAYNPSVHGGVGIVFGKAQVVYR